MKRTYLIAALLFSTQLLHAHAYKLELGIEGGPSASNSVYPNVLNPYTNTTFNSTFGVTGEYHFSGLFSLKTGLYFERKGLVDTIYGTIWHFNDPELYTLTDPVTLDYLIIPILGKVSTGDKAKFFVDGGPYFGYLLNPSIKLSDPYNASSIKDYNYKKYDFGASTGFGFDFPIKTLFTVSFELRFNFGMVNINDKATDGTRDNWSTNLLFGLRYKFWK